MRSFLKREAFQVGVVIVLGLVGIFATVYAKRQHLPVTVPVPANDIASTPGCASPGTVQTADSSILEVYPAQKRDLAEGEEVTVLLMAGSKGCYRKDEVCAFRAGIDWQSENSASPGHSIA